LVFYFQSLQYDENQAVAYYSFTTSWAYFAPLIGSLVADGGYGRYRTILSFGILYVVGLGILTAGAWAHALQVQRWATVGGLFLVCLGTGGIKPCVSAFGADQVALKHDDKDGIMNHHNTDTIVRQFFAYFYFCINVGALTSIATVPIVKDQYGFAWAFAIPTCCMMGALLAFTSQRHAYVHQTTSLSLGRTLQQVGQLLLVQPGMQRICGARSLSLAQKEDDHEEESLNEATGNVDDSIKDDGWEDVARVVHVLPILAMLPVFWCLYDQQGSVWTLQAKRMDLNLWGLQLQPEQTTLINPLEIMILIPLFDRLIYPAMIRNGVDIRPLRRMSWGMLLTAVAFFISGWVEFTLQHQTDNDLPPLNVLWQLPQLTVLSIGEIFISVTGLEFVYSTSPERLKALLLGLFLLTTACGDLLGGALYSTIFTHLERSTIMHVCGFLMLLNLGLFVCVARWYERTPFLSLLRQSPTQIECTTIEHGID